MIAQLTLKREILSNKAILGSLYDEHKKLEVAKTLENPWLNNKTSISAISNGRYDVRPYSSEKYKKAFCLSNVPGRSAILIHQGNYEKDTEGCILVGAEWAFLFGEIAVSKSRATLNYLIENYPEGFLLDILSWYN